MAIGRRTARASFELTNHTTQNIEIGSLGIPMIFNNILYGKNLEQAHAQNVLYDSYIGQDAGYSQVTHLHGKDSSLLVLPLGHTPFEAYNPLTDDPTPRDVTVRFVLAGTPENIEKPYCRIIALK